MNTFDEIIQTKAYSDLNSNELEIIRELVSSEEEYNEMKSFYTEIDQLAISGREEVSVSVKSSLNSVFLAKHPGISQNWNAPEAASEKTIPLYNRTIFRVAALLVLSAGVITVWVSMSENNLEKDSKAEITAKMDSVPLEEQKAPAVEKKEFPLNDAESQKDFTAASDVPKDENADQSVTIMSNATQSSTASSANTYNWSIEKETDKAKTYKITTSSNAASPSSGTYSTKVSFGNVAAKTGTTYFAAPAVKPGKQAAGTSQKKSSDDQTSTMTKAGLNADLNPDQGEVSYLMRTGAESTKDYKPSIKTTDLLTLIEPSF